MSIFRYNFGAIQNNDFRKYLQSKLEFERWEESISSQATIAHYRNFRKICYGFPTTKNNYIIIKQLLKKWSKEYELPFIVFDKKNEKEILFENISFIEDAIYYLRNWEGKKEIYNYNLSCIEAARKIIVNKYKDYDEDSQFILEKSKKKLLLFQGNSFELRTYLLVVQIDKKIYTFLYPLIIAHFGIDNINMIELLQFLDIGYENSSNITSYHPLMDKIYHLVQKTANVIANVVRLTNYIYKIENSKKYNNSAKPQMQYHLYALDIILNEDKDPFLIDIVNNPMYQPSKEESKTIREKNKMFDDILENFVINFAKFTNISYDNSRFIILNDINQYFEYKLIIAKKINNELLGSNDDLSKDGEKFLVKCLNDSNNEFTTDNASFLKEKKNGKQKKKEEKVECIFESDKNEIDIDKKIEDLLKKERKQKIFGIASATLPIFLATYLAKKTYQSFTKKS